MRSAYTTYTFKWNTVRVMVYLSTYENPLYSTSEIRQIRYTAHPTQGRTRAFLEGGGTFCASARKKNVVPPPIGTIVPPLKTHLKKILIPFLTIRPYTHFHIANVLINYLCNFLNPIKAGGSKSLYRLGGGVFCAPHPLEKGLRE